MAHFESHFFFNIKKKGSHRLDEWYATVFANKAVFPSGGKELHAIVKDVLILSHGNADVEKGFSINKSLLVENLLQETLISLRLSFLFPS